VAKPVPHRDKWRIRWLDEHGKRQSAVFDEYKVAQRELSRRVVEVEEIHRGIRSATPPEKTFGDLCDYWLENRAQRKRSRKDDESMIRRHLRPAFGTMRLRDVGVEDVDGYVNDKIDGEELSDKTVSNHVILLGTMLRLATTFKVPWLATVPKFRKPKVALFSRDRPGGFGIRGGWCSRTRRGPCSRPRRASFRKCCIACWTPRSSRRSSETARSDRTSGFMTCGTRSHRTGSPRAGTSILNANCSTFSNRESSDDVGRRGGKCM
jgi:Phage integrase, N-terminal SAM-like domain